MRAIFPRTGAGDPISILSYPTGKTGGSQQLVANASANVVSANFSSGTSVVTLYSNAACFFELGDSSTFANTKSHYLAAGTYLDVALTAGQSTRPDVTNIAFITAVGNAAVYISERY